MSSRPKASIQSWYLSLPALLFFTSSRAISSAQTCIRNRKIMTRNWFKASLHITYDRQSTHQNCIADVICYSFPGIIVQICIIISSAEYIVANGSDDTFPHSIYRMSLRTVSVPTIGSILGDSTYRRQSVLLPTQFGQDTCLSSCTCNLWEVHWQSGWFVAIYSVDISCYLTGANV